MSFACNQGQSRLQVAKVPCHRRCDSMVSHLGQYMLVFENRVYDQMGEMCASYDGGFWEYYELSNGGFFMRVKDDEPLVLTVRAGNRFSKELTSESASIVANLFAYSQLASVYRDDRLTNHYWWLIEYARTLGDFSDISRATN